jgi:hypothetical protein
MAKTLTSREVRREFNRLWRDICRQEPRWTKDKPAKRFEFSTFIDDLHREGRISDAVVQRVTMDG